MSLSRSTLSWAAVAVLVALSLPALQISAQPAEAPAAPLERARPSAAAVAPRSGGIGIAPLAGLDDARAARELANAIAARLEEQHGMKAVRIDRGDELPRATPDASRVREWAAEGDYERIVVGGVLDGDPPELALEIRDGHSGVSVEAFRVAGNDDYTWTSAIGEAAGRIAGRPQPPAKVDEEQPLLGDLRDSDDPIAIEADEIEVAVIEGRRHLQFRRNVKVVQGDITLRTAKLDAFYPAEASQPERLVATGDVHVSQGARQATCDNATYLRSTQQVVCKGRARLWEGCDVVRGREIQFDLEREHFRVNGAASVVLQNASPNADGCEKGASS